MSWAVDEIDLIEGDRKAESVIDDLINQDRRPPAKPRTLTYREKLAAVEHEAMLIMVTGENIAAGFTLSRNELDRAWDAVERLRFIFNAR